MRVEAGVIRFGESHLARLQASAASLGLPVPGRDAFVEAVQSAGSSVQADVVRVALHADDAGEVALTTVCRRRLPDDPVDAITLTGWYARGYALREHKLTSHFHGLWSRRRAQAVGVAEALLVERGTSLVGESGNANVLAFLPDGGIVTPPVDGLLPGILRAAVLVVLAEEGRPASRRPLTVAELIASDGVVLASAARGLVELRSLDGTRLGTPPAERMASLRASLDARAMATGIELD